MATNGTIETKASFELCTFEVRDALIADGWPIPANAAIKIDEVGGGGRVLISWSSQETIKKIQKVSIR